MIDSFNVEIHLSFQKFCNIKNIMSSLLSLPPSFLYPYWMLNIQDGYSDYLIFSILNFFVPFFCFLKNLETIFQPFD